jgi:glycosyltransferase involved in cell wall biosynthesis
MLKRILYIAPNLHYSGATTQLCLLAKELPREQFEVIVVVLSEAGSGRTSLAASGVRIETLGWRRLFDLKPWLRLRRLLNEYRPDVIHAWKAPSLRALAVLGLGHLKRTVFTPGPWPIAEKWIDRRLLRLSRRVVVGGPSEAECYRRLGLPNEKIAVIPPGVHCQKGSSASRELLRKAFGLPANARVIAGVGPMEPHKGFQDAIWTLDILKYVYPDLHLVLIGGGSELARLQDFVQVTRAKDSFHFAGYQDNVADLLGLAEIVWIPSLSPGGIQVALEAMAVGRPIVASRLPALAEIIVDGETGFLVKPSDKPELARRTRLLLEDAGLRERMGTAGRQRAENAFSLSTMVERFAELYETL